MSLLEQWARDHGLPQEWAEFGFWRWKTLPKGQIELVTDLGLEMGVTRVSPAQALELSIAKGVSPCKASGFSIEGQFSSGIDLNRVGRLLPIFGPVRESEELGALRLKAGMNSVLLFSSGSLVVRGPDAESVERITPQLERAVRRAVFCQACGSCVPKCKNEALSIDEGRISVDPDRCTNCLECDNWPCPTYLT
jgi:phosphoadenosine phosphosulfate reductase